MKSLNIKTKSEMALKDDFYFLLAVIEGKGILGIEGNVNTIRS